MSKEVGAGGRFDIFLDSVVPTCFRLKYKLLVSFSDKHIHLDVN